MASASSQLLPPRTAHTNFFEAQEVNRRAVDNDKIRDCIITYQSNLKETRKVSLIGLTVIK